MLTLPFLQEISVLFHPLLKYGRRTIFYFTWLWEFYYIKKAFWRKHVSLERQFLPTEDDSKLHTVSKCTACFIHSVDFMIVFGDT